MTWLDQLHRRMRVPLQLGVVARIADPLFVPTAPRDPVLKPLADVAANALAIADSAAIANHRLSARTVADVVARFNLALAAIAAGLADADPNQRDRWARAIGSGESARDRFIQFAEEFPE